MPVVINASCQVERLRKIVDCENGHAVQIMPPPSYLQALLYEKSNDSDSGLTPDIVLVYKANIKTSTSSLPLDVRDEANLSIDSSMELEGNPLPAPFDDNDEFDVSVIEKKECQWPKGELNHLPLKTIDAQKFMDGVDDSVHGISNLLDVWFLVDGGTKKESVETEEKNTSIGNQLLGSESMIDADISSTTVGIIKPNEKVRIMLGVHATGSWWTRSYIESQGACSIACPEMDPVVMKNSHLEMANLHDYKLNVVVLCRYNILGHHISSDVPVSDKASSVSLELRWRQPSMSVPRQEASARVIVQVAVGNKSSPAHDLWKQLCVLHNLFELLLTCWRDKTTPQALPHLDPASEDFADDSLAVESMESMIKTLIVGGKQALQAQNANRRMSIAPSLMGRQSLAPSANRRQSMAPGFLGRRSIAPQAMKEATENETRKVPLAEALEIAAAGNRENSDVIDGLFSLMIECKTYRELMSAWDLTFMELNEARRPYIRPKNSTRAAKFIQSYLSGQSDSSPDFLEMEGSLLALELLIEMGLEKLTTDYYYIFLESQIVGRDVLQAPQMVRAGLGVPRDKWLASCGQLLGWLAQVHCGLEIALPLQDSLSSNSTPFMASEALMFYQSDESPVRSVAGLLTPGNAIQEFSWNVNIDTVVEHTNKQFDWWRMTLSSDNEIRKVRSVFLRRYLRPIFPPQLCDHSEMLTDQYHCAEAVTISEKF